MSALVLIGTVHLDPAGEAALAAVLRELEPRVVTVEVSPYAVDFRRRVGPRLRARLEAHRAATGELPEALEALAAQLEVPFEVRAAEAYAADRGAALHLLGDDAESRELLEALERDALAEDNLRYLAGRAELPLAERVAVERRRARRYLARSRPVGTTTGSWLDEVEARLAARLDALLRGAGGPVAHVGGWEHLKGLEDRLGARGPVVRLLEP